MKTLQLRLMMASCLAIAATQGMKAADYEVFGGYSVTRMRPANSDNGANQATMNGWNTSIAAYPWSRIGFAADFAGYYGTATGNYTLAGGVPVTAADTDIRQYSFMAGPQVRLLHNRHIETSVHALFGGAYGYVPGEVSTRTDQTTFAAVFGSNWDVRISRRLAMRFSPGLYLTQFGDNQTQKNVRFSVGPVFQFGGER
jgi:hypothetical protein